MIGRPVHSIGSKQPANSWGKSPVRVAMPGAGFGLEQLLPVLYLLGQQLDRVGQSGRKLDI
jgi:hypothetical protein